MKIIKSIFIWVVLISPFINIFADVLPKQSFKGQLVIVQELKINNDTVRLGVSSKGQLLRYDGTKYTNWTPDFDSLYSVDSVKYLRGRIQIYQGGNVDSTEILTVDTTQVLNLQQFVENHSINQELDPVYSIDSSFIKSSLRDIISDTANWNIEDDPIYKSDSSFLKSNIRDWNSSVAKLITAEDTTYWNSKLDIELDPIYVEDSSQIVFWSDTTLENGIVTDHDLMMLEPPVGGYANNLYFDTLSSDVAGYQTLTYTVSLTSEEHAHTVNKGEGNKLIHTYIYPTAVTVSVLPAGLWSFQFYSKVSSPAGVTKIGITYFARHIDNTETDLFTIWSNEINNTTYDWDNWQITNPSYAISVTDRMGARIYLQTTKVTDVIVNYYIGDGYGAYLNNPNKIRHSQLRDLNGDSTYLYVTNNDIVYWNNKVDSEIDPIYSNDSTFLNSGVRNWNSSLAKTIDATDTTYWGRAETDPKYAADSANIVKYVGNDRDLDMGANSISTDTVKIDGVPLLLNTFKQGNLGGASNIFYSTGASSQPASGTVNQVVGNNYIKNQNDSTQDASFKISGSATIGDSLIKNNIVVSGFLSPSANGIYEAKGLILGHYYYQKGNENFYIWSNGSWWYINQTLGDFDGWNGWYQAFTSEKVPLNSSWTTAPGSSGVLTTYENKLTVNGNLNLSQTKAPSSYLTPTISGSGLLNGTYNYVVSYYTRNGETNIIGGHSESIVATNNSILLSNIPVSSDYRVIGRRIYRKTTWSDDVVKYLVVDIADNTTTTYLDNISDLTLLSRPTVNFGNTTGGVIYVNDQPVIRANSQSLLIGTENMKANTGYANTLLGSLIAQDATVMNRTVAVGVSSIFNNKVGARITALGVHSGQSTNSDGGVFLGYGSGFFETGANKLFIDNDTRSSEENGRISSLVYGEFNSNPTLQLFRINGQLEVLSGFIKTSQFKSTIPTGTPPLVVASTTVVDSLNAGLLDGKKASDFLKYTDSVIESDTIKARADMITPKLKTGTTTNNTTFEADGTMVMNGDATVFEDLNFSPLSASGVPATLPDYVTINNTTHREFTSANNQLCGDVKELPHAYKLGTTLQPHAHLFLKSGESVGTTGVTFVLYWELRQITGTTSGSSTLTATSAQLANGNKVDIYTSAFAGAAELGAQLSCTIARTAGDAGDIVLLSWGVHYEADMIGSRTISSK